MISKAKWLSNTTYIYSMDNINDTIGKLVPLGILTTRQLSHISCGSSQRLDKIAKTAGAASAILILNNQNYYAGT